MDSDRNLLFGVLALQLDLIDRDGFVSACAAWATRKDTPLADVLDSQAALESYQKDQEMSQRLADADTGSAPAQRDLAVSHNKLGDAQLRRGECQPALESYQKALEVSRSLADADKGSARAQRDLLVSHSNLGTVYLKLGDVKAAQDNYDQARKISECLADKTKASDALYDAACCCALCVPLADKPETKEKYSARAVELLRQAVAKGYKDAAHMAEDTDLDALRQRDDFKKLVADLEAATKPKDK